MRAAPADGPSDRFVTLSDRLIAPVLLISRTGRITYVNPAATRLLHQEHDLLVGRSADELAHTQDRAPLRRLIRDVAGGRPSGRTAVIRLRAQPALEWQVLECTADNLLGDPDVAGILLSVHDVTASRAEARALSDLAYRDSLTGLANRTRVVEELDRLLASEEAVALVLISIDRLNLVADSLGQVGAEALVTGVAKRARTVIPASGLFGRFEGATFALVLAGSAAEHAEAVGWRIVQRVRGPMFFGAREFLPSVSVGVAAREPSATADSLLWDAGIALHRAQPHGGGRLELFSSGHREEAVARFQLEADLRRAVAKEAFSLAFQPIVHLPSGEVLGSEALLRWHRPGGDLAPADFVPIAEEAGLIVPLGEWVVGEAARLSPWAPGGRVSVNLSARQLAIPSLPRLLDSIVGRHAARPAVQFEVTETLLIEEWAHTADVLREIRRLGYRVGLDDFGTGYSSLAYLRRLPIDFLKLDRSLVADVDADRQARAVVGAVIKMAEAFDLEVVAEGVERASQAEALIELGAGRAQGHLYGRAEELVLDDAPIERSSAGASRQPWRRN